jgi:hypothetical protein
LGLASDQLLLSAWPLIRPLARPLGSVTCGPALQSNLACVPRSSAHRAQSSRACLHRHALYPPQESQKMMKPTVGTRSLRRAMGANSPTNGLGNTAHRGSFSLRMGPCDHLTLHGRRAAVHRRVVSRHAHATREAALSAWRSMFFVCWHRHRARQALNWRSARRVRQGERERERERENKRPDPLDMPHGNTTSPSIGGNRVQVMGTHYRRPQHSFCFGDWWLLYCANA